MTSSPVTAPAVESAAWRAATTIIQLLTLVPDPRHARGKRHQLPAILALSVAAVVSGATSLAAIAAYAQDVGADLLEWLGLGSQVPSEPTIRRVIEAMDQAMFARICGAWTRLRAEQISNQLVIAVDGKTVRGARHHNDRAPHLVAALTHDTGLVLGQVQVDAKTNEIPAMIDLLRLMDLNNVVVTADALHTQTNTAKFITQAGGDYVLTVKGNNPKLLAALKDLPWKHVPSISQVDRRHGRRVRRTVQAVEVPAWIDYPGTRQVLRVRRTRTHHGKRSSEVVFLLCSKSMLQARPEQVADWIQGHWHVENRLHWVRDVSFDEDRQQLRTGNGPAVMAGMRNLAITLLRLAGWDNIAEACRHHSRHLERTVKLLLTT